MLELSSLQIPPICTSFNCAQNNMSLIDRYIDPVSRCYLSVLDLWQKKIFHAAEQYPMLFFSERVYWNLDFQKEYSQKAQNLLSGSIAARKSFYEYVLHLREDWYGKLNEYCNQLKTFSDSFSAPPENHAERVIALLELFFSGIGQSHFEILGASQILFELLSGFCRKDNIDVISILQDKPTDNKILIAAVSLTEIANQIETYEPRSSSFNLENKIDQFVSLHGHRGISNDDLADPHLCENADIVADLVHLFAQSSCRTYSQKSTSLPQGACEETNYIAELSAKYISLREDQRYYFDLYFTALRKEILKIADEFSRHDYIKNKTSIFQLTIDEIAAICRGKSSDGDKLQELIAHYEKAFEASKLLCPPFLIRAGLELKLQKERMSSSFKVIPTSRGKAEGYTKIIKTASDIYNFKQGEILVVKFFHPNYTPLLSRAGGLIMTYGNLLSHGSIMAREYSVPAVIFNAPATEIFSDGMEIEIDADLGRIHIISE